MSSDRAREKRPWRNGGKMRIGGEQDVGPASRSTSNAPKRSPPANDAFAWVLIASMEFVYCGKRTQLSGIYPWDAKAGYLISFDVHGIN
jgi:hypothetical protein